MPSASATHTAFGVRFTSDFALPSLPTTSPGSPHVFILAASAEDLGAVWSGGEDPPVWQTVFRGLGALDLHMGRAGDHLFSFDGVATFHLDAEAVHVRCLAPWCLLSEPQRFLLDTVLWSVSLLRGHQALHASAFVWRSGPVAIAAPQGGGKTSLLAEFLLRGRTLFADDVVALERRADGLLAHPGPPLLNLPLLGVGAEAAAGLGTRLSVFEDDEPEAWTLMDRQAAPAPVEAIILLRRSPQGVLDLRPAAATVFDLLAHSIGLRHLPSSARDRFLMFADVLETVPVLELLFGDGDSPAMLADRLERDLDGLLVVPGPESTSAPVGPPR